MSPRNDRRKDLARIRVPRPENTPPAPQPPSPGLPTYVTDIASIEHQVGAHVIHALRHEGAAAVISTVYGGVSGQRIVSIPLNEETLMRVQQLLAETSEQEQSPTREVPCIGFHCILEDAAAAAAARRASELPSKPTSDPSPEPTPELPPIEPTPPEAPKKDPA